MQSVGQRQYDVTSNSDVVCWSDRIWLYVSFVISFHSVTCLHYLTDDDRLSQSQAVSPPPCNQLASINAMTPATCCAPATPTSSTRRGNVNNDPLENIAMAEAEYRAAEHRLQCVQDMVTERQGGGFDPFQSTFLFWAEQEFIRAREVGNCVHQVKWNNLNSTANTLHMTPYSPKKLIVASPIQNSTITSLSMPQGKKQSTGNNGLSLSSTPQRRTEAARNEPSTPSKMTPGPLTPSKKTPGPLTPSKKIPGPSTPSKKTPGLLTPLTLQSLYPNCRHYTIVRGRRVGVYNSW